MEPGELPVDSGTFSQPWGCEWRNRAMEEISRGMRETGAINRVEWGGVARLCWPSCPHSGCAIALRHTARKAHAPTHPPTLTHSRTHPRSHTRSLTPRKVLKSARKEGRSGVSERARDDNKGEGVCVRACACACVCVCCVLWSAPSPCE